MTGSAIRTSWRRLRLVTATAYALTDHDAIHGSMEFAHASSRWG